MLMGIWGGMEELFQVFGGGERVERKHGRRESGVGRWWDWQSLTPLDGVHSTPLDDARSEYGAESDQYGVISLTQGKGMKVLQ